MNYNVPFLLGNRYSKKSGPLGTYRGDKSMFYIPTTMIAVVECGNYIHYQSGKKWGRGLCGPQHVTDILTKSSILTNTY